MAELKKQYTLFCGTFSYSPKKKATLVSRFLPWKERLGEDAFQGFGSYVRTNFYESYVQAAFPELLQTGKIREQNELLDHRTVKAEEPEVPWKLLVKGQSLPFLMEYIDLYFFPGGIGIFAIKASLAGAPSFEALSDFLFGMRIPQSRIERRGTETTVKDFIRSILEISGGAVKDPFGATSYNSKLKSFCVTECALDVSNEAGRQEERELLFELGSAAPIGTIRRDDDYAPAPEYFENLMNEQRMAFFKNWSAFALFDTFTVLINKTQEGQYTTFSNFESSYFPIYVHSLFLKYALYAANDVLANYPAASKQSREMRDWFVDIKNRYHLDHLSYNFLPNEIDTRIRHALDIDTEMDSMSEKLEQVNDLVSERQEAQSNFILAFLSVVTLSSALWDCSEWFQKFFGVPDESYRILSGGIVVFVVFMALLLKFRGKRSS